MPRKGPAPRRDLMPDPIYRSVLVTQIVNKILLSGKRSTAESIVYAALENIAEKTGGEPISTSGRSAPWRKTTGGSAYPARRAASTRARTAAGTWSRP